MLCEEIYNLYNKQTYMLEKKAHFSGFCLKQSRTKEEVGHLKLHLVFEKNQGNFFSIRKLNIQWNGCNKFLAF